MGSFQKPGFDTADCADRGRETIKKNIATKILFFMTRSFRFVRGVIHRDVFHVFNEVFSCREHMQKQRDKKEKENHKRQDRPYRYVINTLKNGFVHDLIFTG